MNLLTTAAPAHPQPSETLSSRGGRLIGALAALGGILLLIGTLLPWFSLFAGLQSYSGLTGWNGRVLLLCGALTILAGCWFLARSTAWLRWTIGLFGFAQLAYTAWLTVQLLQTYHSLAANPLVVATLGPGIFVALAGAALSFGTLFVAYE